MSVMVNSRGIDERSSIDRCVCCGSGALIAYPVLWPELIAAWEIAPHEVAYMERQQGLHCRNCEVNLRTMAVAQATMRFFGADGTFAEFVQTPDARRLRVLEINRAGNLTPYLEQLPYHLLGEYPALDMLALPFGDGHFDLVLHSDTLEHVPEPIRGLTEIRRVLHPKGACIFSIPMIVDRLTRTREGLPPSYHGNADEAAGDWAVVTEYGADAWKHVAVAGFSECRIFVLEYPAAQAIVAVP